MKEYKEFRLTDLQIERLYKLSKEKKTNDNLKIRVSHASGIGQGVDVIVDGKEVDITDVDSW